MPYIPNEQKLKHEDWRFNCDEPNRVVLDRWINTLAFHISKIHKAYGYDGAFLGLVNYSITRLVTKIILDNFDRPRYWHSPVIRGVMQDIGDELYRRVFVPYEDVQIKKNGDVPEYQELLKRIK